MPLSRLRQASALCVCNVRRLSIGEKAQTEWDDNTPRRVTHAVWGEMHVKIAGLLSTSLDTGLSPSHPSGTLQECMFLLKKNGSTSLLRHINPSRNIIAFVM